VRGTSFASLSEDGGVVQFRLPEDAVEAVVAEHPEAERITRQGTTIGVGLPVDGLDVRVLDRLLRKAWDAAAPKRLVAEHSPAAAASRTIGLPAVGRPAAAALGQAGILTLEEVAAHTEQELLALHGVGPKAVRILREALAAGGLAFRAG
jgi:Helix-hairpin-helix domain